MKLAAVSLGLLWTLSGCADRAGAGGPGSFPTSRGAPAEARASVRDEASDGRRVRQQPMLLIFASDEQDGRLAGQRRALGPILGDLERRNVLVVEIVGTDPLRDTFAVPLQGFHVLVVGRDDDVKLQLQDVAEAGQIITALGAPPQR